MDFAYGGTRYDAGGQMTLYRYTGQRIETGTGLYDYGARWYDPAIGRFLAADRIVPNPGDSQALNRYMYFAGNPLKYTDPTGHFFVPIAAMAVAGPLESANPHPPDKGAPWLARWAEEAKDIINEDLTKAAVALPALMRSAAAGATPNAPASRVIDNIRQERKLQASPPPTLPRTGQRRIAR